MVMDSWPTLPRSDREIFVNTRPRLALYQPDIPQNAGTLFRLGACLGLGVDVIEPCGFLFDDRKLRRAGMDYLDLASVTRHASWEHFDRARKQAGRRLVLLTTAGAERLDHFAFRADDTIMVGRESAGVPEAVAAACDARVVLPMRDGARSLNVALAAGMAASVALGQLGLWPGQE
jgi:tRNA (cytidine/uridine-2'-O-)-methyltransferase